MHARFFGVMMGVFVGLSVLLPLSVLALPRADGGDRLSPVLFVGIQVLAISILLRAVLGASVPQQDPGLRDRWRRWRDRGTAAGVLAGAVTTVVGVFGAAPPVTASVVSVFGLLALVVLVGALDRYAVRTAATHPVDAVRPGDDDRLAPGAVLAFLRRRAAQGMVAGAVAGVLTGIAVGLLGPRGPEMAWAGLTALVVVASVVLGFGSIGLLWAAARRLNAVTFGDRARAKRIRKAILRRRTDELDEQDRELATRWAAVAEPAMLLQLVTQIPVLVTVPGAQSVLLILDPDDVFRRWLVALMVVVVLPVFVIAVSQWRRVRAFVRTPVVS